MVGNVLQSVVWTHSPKRQSGMKRVFLMEEREVFLRKKREVTVYSLCVEEVFVGVLIGSGAVEDTWHAEQEIGRNCSASCPLTAC